jgi:lysozyme family protein
VSQGIKTIQRALNVVVDGILGEQTIAAINQRDTLELIEQFCEERLQFYQSLPTWDTFGRGWQTRVENVKETATRMAQDSATS